MKILVLKPTRPNFTERLIKYFFDNFRDFLQQNSCSLIIEKIISKNDNMKYWKSDNIDTLKKNFNEKYSDLDYILLFQYTSYYKEILDDLRKFKIIFINTEQSTNTKNKRLFDNFRYLNDHGKYIFIDYNQENYTNFEKYIDHQNYLTLEPYLHNFRDNYEKTIDIGIYNRQSKHDNEFVKKFIPNIYPKCQNMLGKFNKDRLNFIGKCKIFINIHAQENYKICETHRVNELVASRCIVISQKCLNEELVGLGDYILFAENNKIEEITLDVLNNYDRYYEKIFAKKTNNDIFEKIGKKYVTFIKIL